MLTHQESAAGQDFAALVPGTDVVEHLFHELRVAELGVTCVHKRRDHCANFDGVDAEVVGDHVQSSDVVRIGQPAVGAEQSDGFVLQGRAPSRRRFR